MSFCTERYQDSCIRNDVLKIPMSRIWGHNCQCFEANDIFTPFYALSSITRTNLCKQNTRQLSNAYCRFSPCPPQHAHFICAQFPLLLLSTEHSASYTMAGFIALLYILSFNCVGMFLSHTTPVVSLHFDQAIFTLLLTSFSALPLASNN